MPRKTLPRILTVSPGRAPLTLHVAWDNGQACDIDLTDLVGSFRVYEPLRRSPDLFRQVRLGEHGTDIVWNGEIDMAADTLWRLAREQVGHTMSSNAFRLWRERRGYTLDTAAAALGLSRRTVAYYEHGEKPIPRVVALATRALELT